MDFAVIAPALKTWAASLTGIAEDCVRWENEPEVQDNGARVVLRWVSEVSAGADATHYTFAEHDDPLLEMTPTTTGNRVLTLQVDVEVQDQRPGVNAQQLASRARTRVRCPRLLAALEDLGLAVASVGQLATTDYPVDDRYVSRRSFEVRLNAVARETDADGATSYIATVEATAHVSNPAGTELPVAIQPGGTLL